MESAYDYLIVIHIPYTLDSDGSVVTGDMWIKDLRGMAHNLGRITVAAPMVSRGQFAPEVAGSFSCGRV